MRTDSIDQFLDSLAARVPAPGGGASAALHAAQGAALVAMVARYSDGDRFAAHADVISAARDTADGLREDAVQLAAADALALGRVGEASAMPRDDAAQRAARGEAVAAALLGAARVPARVIEVAGRILVLAEVLRPIGNRSVLSDVAAAAEALRAALGTARVNVEVNLHAITDTDARAELLTALEPVDDLLLRAAKTTATVREQILR